MTETATANMTVPCAASPRSAQRRIALVIGGVVGLIYQTVAVDRFAIGLPLTGMSAVALASGAIGNVGNPGFIALPHLGAVILLLLNLAGLCASRCGGFETYRELLGVPTAVAGLGMHAVAAVLHILATRSGERALRVMAVGASIACIGASLFYAGVLVSYQSWCASCAAVHACMVVQTVMILAAISGSDRFQAMLGLMVVALGINLVYHHRVNDRVANDPRDLLAYLVSKRPQAFDFDAVVQERLQQQRLANPAAGIARQAPAAHQGDIAPQRDDDASQRVVGRDADPGARGAPRDAQASTLRDAATAPLWGSLDAPLRLRVLLNPGCGQCRQQWGDLLELRDLVDRNRVCVDFKLRYDANNDTANAGVTLTYGAGVMGQRQLIDVGCVVFDQAQPPVSGSEILTRIRSLVDRDRLMEFLEKKESLLQTLVTASVQVATEHGVQGDPHLWLIDSATDRELNYWAGFTKAAVLRRSIENFTPSTRSGSTPNRKD